MTKSTRTFLLTSTAIVVGGVVTGLVVYLTGGFSAVSSARAATPAELSYVPDDASVVAYANVREVMLSELRGRLQEHRPEGGSGHRDFLERTGIDIETDIDHVVACMLPEDDPEGDQSEGFVLARGRFDDVRLETLAREFGGVAEEYRGTRVIAHDDQTLAFLEPGLLLIGERSAARRAIDTAADGQDVTANAEMMRLVGEVALGSDAWGVGQIDSLTAQAQLPAEVADQLPAVRWFSASGHVNGGIDGVLRAEARDDQAAEDLREVVRGFLALARLQTNGGPELQTMLRSLQLGGSGSTVAVSFSIPLALIDAFAENSERTPIE